MKTIKTYLGLFFAFGLFLFMTNLNADITINVHNLTGDEVYLFLDSADVSSLSDTSINETFLGLDPNIYNSKNPYTFSFSSINSGNLLFAIPDLSSKNIFTGSTTKPSATGNDISGFIEFSYIPTTSGQQTVYWDVSNVDNVGLLCGVQLTDAGNNNTVQNFGYNQMQSTFLTGLLSACSLDNTSSAYGACNSKKTPSITYNFLRGPTICPDPYKGIYTTYLTNLKNTGTQVTFTSDDLSTNTSYLPDSHGTKWTSTVFSGSFCPPTPMTGPDSQTINDVVLLLTSTLNANVSQPVSIYFTKSALNSDNIVRGDSTGGVWVYADSSICDSPVNSNVNLNWVGADSSSTTLFQAWCDSVQSRGLICALNCGEISDTGMAYDNMNQATWSPDCQKKYANPYNSYIVQNSNSYGMAYSDAAHAKVQYVTTPNVTADLYIFGPNDSNTANYYNTNPPVPLPPPQVAPQIEVNLATGCDSLSPVSYDGTTMTTGNPVNIISGWHRIYFGDPSLKQWIWVKLGTSGIKVSGGTGCFSQATGNPDQPTIPQDASFADPGQGSGIYTMSLPANCSWNTSITPSPTPPSD